MPRPYPNRARPTPAGSLAGGDANHRFVTSPPVCAVRPTRIWVLGNSGAADLHITGVTVHFAEGCAARF